MQNAHFQLDIECTWMRESKIDWIFQIPACIVLVANLMFLLRIMWVSIPLQREEFHFILLHFSLIDLPSSPSPTSPPGPDYKAAFSKYRGDQTIPESIEGPASPHPVARPYLFGGAGRTERGCWEPHFCHRSSLSAQHPSKW